MGVRLPYRRRNRGESGGGGLGAPSLSSKRGPGPLTFALVTALPTDTDIYISNRPAV